MKYWYFKLCTEALFKYLQGGWSRSKCWARSVYVHVHVHVLSA